MLKSLITAFALVATALAAEDPARVWDLATGYEEGLFHTRNLALFAEDVAEATDGALQIQLHPENILFEGDEIAPAVARGLVPMGEVFMSRLADKGAVFTLDSLPLVATSYEDAERLWHISRPAVEERLKEDGLTLLFTVPWPGQTIISTMPIHSLEDLKGRTLRTYNPATERLAQLIGAVPTEVPRDKLSREFTTGRLAAMIASPSTGETIKAWEFASHITNISAWFPKNIVVVNTDALNALPPIERRAVMQAAAEAEERGWKMSRNDSRTLLNMLRANGMEVSEPDAALSEELKDLSAEMENWWRKSAGETGNAVLDAYRAGQ